MGRWRAAGMTAIAPFRDESIDADAGPGVVVERYCTLKIHTVVEDVAKDIGMTYAPDDTGLVAAEQVENKDVKLLSALPEYWTRVGASLVAAMIASDRFLWRSEREHFHSRERDCRPARCARSAPIPTRLLHP